MILGLCGYPGSGKDAIAAHLVSQHGFTRMAFADPMRAALLALDPWVDVPESTKCRKLSELIEWHGWDYVKREYPDVRTYLQRMGTEAGRDIHGQDCWLKLAAKSIDKASRVVVTDVRFANEVEFLRQRGAKFIRVTRPGVGPVNNHTSEQLDYTFAQYELRNDRTLEQLSQSMDRLLIEIAKFFH